MPFSTHSLVNVLDYSKCTPKFILCKWVLTPKYMAQKLANSSCLVNSMYFKQNSTWRDIIENVRKYSIAQGSSVMADRRSCLLFFCVCDSVYFGSFVFFLLWYRLCVIYGDLGLIRFLFKVNKYSITQRWLIDWFVLDSFIIKTVDW